MNIKIKKDIKKIYTYICYFSFIIMLLILNNNTIFANTNQTDKLKKLVGLDLEKNDFMGSSVAISNDYSVVSLVGDNAKEDDDDYLRRNGSVAIYKFVENDWKLIKTLFPNSSRNHDGFGYAVAIDGDYIVVGAPIEDYFSNVVNRMKNAVGAIYIFKKDFGGADNWGEIKKIVPTDIDLLDYINFGNSVAISGNNIIVGAYKDYYKYPEFGFYETGSAYIFEKNTGGLDNWGEVKKIYSSDKQMNSHFGFSVAIYNDYAIVGAVNHNSNSEQVDESYNYFGAAYIYKKDLGGLNNWGELKKIISSTPGFRNLFGHSVAIDNNFVVVGSPSVESPFIYQNEKNNYSSAYIFEKDFGGADNWGEVKQIIPQSLDLFNNFGSSVSINGDYIVIGSSEERYDDLNKNQIEDAGATYIYHKNYGGVGNWGQFKKIVPNLRNSDDEFGFSVAISKNNIIIGAPYVDTKSTNNRIIENSGAAYIYNLSELDTINNITLNQNIHIYPNPSTNLLNIELDETKKYNTISIYNIVGMEVYSSTINNNYLTINTLDLSNGFYYLHISNELNEFITQSFVVNK